MDMVLRGQEEIREYTYLSISDHLICGEQGILIVLGAGPKGFIV